MVPLSAEIFRKSAFVLVLLLLCYLLYEVKEFKQGSALQASEDHHHDHDYDHHDQIPQPHQRLHDDECSNYSQAKFTCPKDDGFDRERIVFVHVPKTGGSSFRTWLQTHFSPANRSWFYHHAKPPKDWFQGSNYHLEASFESAHAPARSMLQGARVNATVITVLRNPTSRLVSSYFHACYKNTKAIKFASFEQYVESFGDGMSDKEKSEARKYGDSLEQAQAFLEKRVSLVGIYERMPETLWLARELLPWLKDVPFPNRNKGNYNNYSLEMISARSLKQLHLHFQEEYQLYAVAEKIFNQQLQCVSAAQQGK